MHDKEKGRSVRINREISEPNFMRTKKDFIISMLQSKNHTHQVLQLS